MNTTSEGNSHVNPIIGWKALAILLYEEAGARVIPESIVVEKRLPYEHLNLEAAENEQPKKISHH